MIPDLLDSPRTFGRQIRQFRLWAVGRLTPRLHVSIYPITKPRGSSLQPGPWFARRMAIAMRIALCQSRNMQRFRPILHTVLAGLGTVAGLSVVFSGELDSVVGSADPSQRDLAVIKQAADRQVSVQQQQTPRQISAKLFQSAQQDTQRQLDELRQQESILRQELAGRSQQLQQRTDEIREARAEADRLKQQIASLKQQEAEAKLQQQSSVIERQGTEGVSLAPAKKAALAPPKARHHPPATATQPQSPSPARALMAARQLVTEGRPDDARRLLVMAQTQMVFRPVTPEAPDAQGFSVPATALGDAIRWLDLGATTQAMQAMNAAIENSSGRMRVWSGSSAGALPAYSQSSPPRF